MWQVICFRKDISTGKTIAPYPITEFKSRIVAEEYVDVLSGEALIDGNYIAGFITHPIYGRFLLDPSYWDIININKRVMND